MKMFMKNKMVHVVKEKLSHIWTVEYNPKNGIFFIHNEKTKLEWQLSASEFVYDSAMWNSIVDTFPNYIHKQVWKVHARYFR